MKSSHQHCQTVWLPYQEKIRKIVERTLHVQVWVGETRKDIEVRGIRKQQHINANIDIWNQKARRSYVYT